VTLAGHQFCFPNVLDRNLQLAPVRTLMQPWRFLDRSGVRTARPDRPAIRAARRKPADRAWRGGLGRPIGAGAGVVERPWAPAGCPTSGAAPRFASTDRAGPDGLSSSVPTGFDRPAGEVGPSPGAPGLGHLRPARQGRNGAALHGPLQFARLTPRSQHDIQVSSLARRRAARAGRRRSSPRPGGRPRDRRSATVRVGHCGGCGRPASASQSGARSTPAGRLRAVDSARAFRRKASERMRSRMGAG